MTDLQAALLLSQMDDMEALVERRDANAQYLNAQLREVPGISPMKRHHQVSRQSYYCFSFRYDATAWEGVPVQVFRRALAAETGLGVSSTYEPLNACSLYKPHTKRRHRLSDDYWTQIDPARFDLPVCRRAFQEEGVVIWHAFLLGERADMDDIFSAVTKLYENRAELYGG
jgi:dTDP-4-amino-4,6-dideoxygalactose transaminase